MSVDPRTAIHALAALLDAGYETPVRGGAVREDGVHTLGYPDYDERVFAGLEAGQELAGTDYDYLAHIERIQQQPIARATLEELATWFTWLLRGERFCDGHVAQNLESGRVRALVTRLLELSPAP
ncbi:DUF6508 domain-containing protein [Paeniglutamicibacter sp. NPDC091659]|uniref:DUF6508 domain-containing protein n=1 Tax=Paeniglutamicibacter sp. NPDC091659 TaxID=3364389 RepID=UPI00382590C8